MYFFTLWSGKASHIRRLARVDQRIYFTPWRDTGLSRDTQVKSSANALWFIIWTTLKHVWCMCLLDVFITYTTTKANCALVLKRGKDRVDKCRCASLIAVIIHSGFLPQDLGKMYSPHNLDQHRQPYTYNWVFQRRKTHETHSLAGLKQ